MEATSPQTMTLATDNELLESYESALATMENYNELVGRIEMEIHRRIDARGGTSLPNADDNGEQIWTCEREDTYTYDQAAFLPLLEMFNQTEMDACYVPAHEETKEVPAKWVTVKVKAIATRHGDGAPEIVERAKIPKSSKIKFSRRINKATGEKS